MTLQRAAYLAELSDFIDTQDDTILGAIVRAQKGDVTPAQRDAWRTQIKVLRKGLVKYSSATIAFEYLIPRMGKRVDNIIIIDNIVYVLEFKVGAESYDQSAIRQAMDYALDLRNFHSQSENVTLVPILVATSASSAVMCPISLREAISDVQLANAETLGDIIDAAVRIGGGGTICASDWFDATYRPTPTIIEASKALYAGHHVEEITRSEAGAINLSSTTNALVEIINQSQSRGEKTICFVTGVPGSGKTLAGLNLACERRRTDLSETEHAVFLSGNGPLVKVLREALSRDEVAAASSMGKKILKEDATRKVSSFIQNVHHFRDECLSHKNPPAEKVVVFDEAQRAWDTEQASKFMRMKRGVSDFGMSEPEFLIGAMDRHDGWAVIVCLVGGGQEIHTGESGIQEWIRALIQSYPEWEVYLPKELEQNGYVQRGIVEKLSRRSQLMTDLHLGVSIRSFRSEIVSECIGSLLEGADECTHDLLKRVTEDYPIRMTRSLQEARCWIRQQARGSERYGLVASSGAKRLKPLGIQANGVKENEIYWFLNDESDVRSSYYLEDAASEFEVQGLELDWAVVIWDADFRRSGQEWSCYNFRGTQWQDIHKESSQKYRLNAYRVLLTRARQGLVIVVPEGDRHDNTRLPELYDPTWEYLNSLGIERL